MYKNLKFLEHLAEIIKVHKELSVNQSYTAKLFTKGKVKIANKIGEEATELITAFLAEGNKEVVEESADLIYHMFVLLEYSDLSIDDVCSVLKKRAKKNKND